jgi:hypothetical protein
MKGESDLIGLMIEASSGKHAIDQTKELTTNILKDDDVPTNTNNVTENNIKQVEGKILKPGKYLLSGKSTSMKTLFIDLINGCD